MPGPKKKTRRESSPIKVWVTPNEKAAIRAKAGAHSLSASSYLRRLGLPLPVESTIDQRANILAYIADGPVYQPLKRVEARGDAGRQNLKIAEIDRAEASMRRAGRFFPLYLVLFLLEQRHAARDAKLLRRFCALCPRAEEYLHQIKERRLNPRQHIAKIIALSEVYSSDKVARAMRPNW
jgi:hypothetical protein